MQMLIFLSVTNQHLDTFWVFVWVLYGYMFIARKKIFYQSFLAIFKGETFCNVRMYQVINFQVCNSLSVQWWVSKTASVQTIVVILTYDLPRKTDSVICTYGLPAVAMGPKCPELQPWSDSLCIITAELHRTWNINKNILC